MERMLVLAPHTDDGELGCGASLSKWLRSGNEVFYAAFSVCDDSLPSGLLPGTLKKELYDATDCLGIPENNVIVYDYKVRHFSSHRQEILDDMIALQKQLRPDTVLMPTINDIHQDHKTVATEGLRAFKRLRILAYEVPWNNYVFHNQCFSFVEEEDVERKVAALACYHSQQGRDYVKPEFIRALLLTHGVQIGVKYAEVFEIPRWILDLS